ncbi:MAG: hydantoinase B/oxoprolinase family protein [Steroidobacteraceae bacterium]
MRTERTLDPITVEVIRSYFQSTARQMRSTLVRASFNPVIYEMIDFSIGIYSRDAELIAEGPGIPFFMGTLTFTIRSVMKHLGLDNVHDGDVILSTYSYWTGSHPQDAVIIRPIFVEGSIFGYTAVKAHWMDLGAKDIYGTDTTDIWQEGLQLHAVKVVKRGKLDDEIVGIIRANSRMPTEVIGDLTAEISACGHGVKRIQELVHKYGTDTVQGAIASILDHGERIARESIKAMPDGTWSAESALDNNGITQDQVPFKATVRIAGDEITVDTSGSAPQQVGPVNSPFPSTVSAIRLVLKMIIAPNYDANEGFFRPVKVISPEGSVFNPKAPAPIFLSGWTAQIMAESLFQVMAKIAPDRSVARSGGDIGGVMFSGVDPVDGSFFAGGEDECCGQGAGMDQDGENALILFVLGESSNVPIEICEERWPILTEKYELRPDSGGAGKWRGGVGVVKQWKALTDLKLIGTIEQTKAPAWGVDGGQSGKTNSMTISVGLPHERPMGKASGWSLPAGERLLFEMGGGGGWGDPLDRDPARVLNDVVGGYVSKESAEREYAVVVRQSETSYSVDDKATRALRQKRRSRP